MNVYRHGASTMQAKADKGNDICGLPYFCGKMGVYMVIYRSKDKNTTQGNLAELVGSPVAPIWCK